MLCGICGGEATLVRETRPFPVGAREVMIDDEFMHCARCEERYYIDGMAEATFRRAAARIREEDGLLAPDEIVAIRGKYGLSQAGLEQLIGAGEKTVVRWERGSVAQNRTADTLLRVLADHPDAVAKLARERGVKLRTSDGAKPARARGRKPSTAPVRRAGASTADQDAAD